jgi:hypothetical protein
MAMRTVYLKPITFECHVSQNPNGTLIPYETEFFDGKCDAFVEGYRIVPDGESWKDSDGFLFRGEMIAPWKPYDELDAAQREYEREQMAEYKEALSIVGVTA